MDEEKIVLELTDVQPKKHSVRFDAEDENSAVTSIYIKNQYLKKLGDADTLAKGVRITIEPIK